MWHRYHYITRLYGRCELMHYRTYSVASLNYILLNKQMDTYVKLAWLVMQIQRKTTFSLGVVQKPSKNK